MSGVTTVSIPNMLAQMNNVYQRYDGSLTTPPCTEGVKWIVGVSDVGINQPQQIVFQYALSGLQNYRTPQPLNGRKITPYKRA
jgi:carbonic anhydrase